MIVLKLSGIQIDFILIKFSMNANIMKTQIGHEKSRLIQILNGHIHIYLSLFITFLKL